MLFHSRVDMRSPSRLRAMKFATRRVSVCEGSRTRSTRFWNSPLRRSSRTMMSMIAMRARRAATRAPFRRGRAPDRHVVKRIAAGKVPRRRRQRAARKYRRRRHSIWRCLARGFGAPRRPSPESGPRRSHGERARPADPACVPVTQARSTGYHVLRFARPAVAAFGENSRLPPPRRRIHVRSPMPPRCRKPVAHQVLLLIGTQIRHGNPLQA